MRRHPVDGLALRSAILLVGFGLCYGDAMGDVTKKVYNHGQSYDYRIIHMPDIDQRREALPGNGSMFCVPTSQMNLMGYCARHGFPMVFPGPRDWQSQDNYAMGDFAVELMGSLMNTDPGSGTNNGSWAAGAEQFLILGGRDQLTTTLRASVNGTKPLAANLAIDAVQGGLVGFAYRRYNIVGFDGAIPILNGTGAHAVTMVRAKAAGTSATISVHDPADTSDPLSAQSPFSIREFATSDQVVEIGAGSPSLFATAIDFDPQSMKMNIIAAEMVVRAKEGFSFTNTGLSAHLIRMTPYSLAGAAAPSWSTVNWPNAATLHDAVPLPTGAMVLAIEKQGDGTGVLKEWNPSTGQATTVAPGVDARRLCVGRKRQVYVADAAGKILCLDPDRGYAITAATSSAPPVTAMAYDDAHDELLILSIAAHRIAKFGSGLGGPPANLIVSASVPMSGAGSIAVDPPGEQVWFTTDASDGIFGVSFGSPSTASIFDAAIVDPKGIAFDDLGHLFVSRLAGGDRTVLELENVRGEWLPRAGSVFTGLACGDRCEMGRSRSNVDPATSEDLGPNLDPADILLGVERAPCDADLDGSDGIDGADIAILLGAWGSSATLADINEDGIVDAADLGAMLGSWGPC